MIKKKDISISSAHGQKIVKESIENKERFNTGRDGGVLSEGMSAMSPWPFFDEDEIQAAASVLRSGRVNQWTGEEVEKFQQEFAAACGVKHAIALANGSVALELALKALEIGPGDEVVVTPRTFIASASCAVLQGATPVFTDVDRDTQNIHAESIRKVLSTKTRAIIAVHLAGWPCDMESIMGLAQEHDLKVIEDCAQAHGASYRGKPVGAFGHISAFSFCQDKIMTTGGEGGMLLTDDDGLWAFCWSYKDHGKSYESVYSKAQTSGFRWLHDGFGTNWRMTEMQAAIGRVQLRKLQRWVEIRRRNAAILSERFSRLKALRLTLPSVEAYHSYYKYYVFIRLEQLKPGWDRDRIMNRIVAQGIPCFSGSCSEIYLEKAFESSDLQPRQRLEVARELGETSLMFLVHPTLTKEDMEAVAEVVEQVMGEASL
jgi:dTDP-4-amino-4,6-dideoxygalactose transaminase